MSLCFLDSSALVKRYVDEPGSGWVRALAVPTAGNLLIIARITWVEVLSALARREREENLASTAVKDAVDAFRDDLDVEYQVIALDGPAAELTGDMVRRRPLRAYDAVQLASALRVSRRLQAAKAEPLRFVSADDRLLAVAQAEGLETESPQHHA